MFKKTLIGLAIATISMSSWANLTFGAHHINYSNDDISLNGAAGAIGLRIDINDKFYLMPELRIGSGIDEDDYYVGVNPVSLEISSYSSLRLRGQFDFHPQMFAYVTTAYTNLELTGTFAGQSHSADASEFGGGAGFGFRLTEHLALEASYEAYDEDDIISAGITLYL